MATQVAVAVYTIGVGVARVQWGLAHLTQADGRAPAVSVAVTVTVVSLQE